MKPIKLLLVDDHAVVRMGLASLLGTRREFTVVGEASDGETAIRKTLSLKPDVVVMDLVMPDMDGVETTRQIHTKMPETNILILTSYGSANGISHALEVGAIGAILKNISFPDMVNAIISASMGKRVLSPEIEQLLTNEPSIPPLSSRQEEVLNSVTQGLSNEQIAALLNISLPVVKEHIRALFTKLGASSRAEAVAIALRKHLLKI